MPKITVNITDDAHTLLRMMTIENNASQNQLVTQAIMELANEENKTAEMMQELRRVRAASAANERKLSVVYDILNNFLLCFAADPDEYVSADQKLHLWVEEAEKQYIDQVRQKSNHKKWGGGNK